MRVSDVGAIDLRVKSSISVSQSRGPQRRSSGPGDCCNPIPESQDRNTFGRPTRDKDPPLAAFEARVLVKVDIASWLRANPGPQAIIRGL